MNTYLRAAIPQASRILALIGQITLLLCFVGFDSHAHPNLSKKRIYILNDYDFNTNAGLNDFFANKGKWDYNGAVISSSFEHIAGTNFCLKIDYDLTKPASAGGWWEQFAYNYADVNNPIFDLSRFEEFRFSVRGAGSYTTRFYLEFIQGTFEMSKRIEITGVTDSFQERTIVLRTALAGFDLSRMRQVSLVLENTYITQKIGTLFFDNFYFVSAEEGFSTDDEFLELISKRAFSYFMTNAHPQSGLVRDTAGNPNICSIAAVGFQLTALGIGAERQWITRIEAATIARKILATLYNAKQDATSNGISGYKGFYYHLLNIGTALRDGTSELSSIDSALFFAGLLFAREYFNDSSSAVERDIQQLADNIFNRIDWNWMLDKNRNHFYMEWTPERGFVNLWWNYYTDETLLVTLLAIGSGQVDEKVFYAWQRVPGAYKEYHLIQSWWGALFTHFFAHCWFNLEPLGVERSDSNPINWWNNSVQAVLANRQFCIDQATQYQTYSDSSWGLTDCFGPEGYNGNRGKSYGAYPLGEPPPNHDGTIPTFSAGSCIIFFPKAPGQNEAIRALKNYYHNYPKLWGLYGLKDSYNLGTLPDSTDDWYADQYVGLGVGPLLIMIENYRSGLVWKYFMRNAHVCQAVRSVFRDTLNTQVAEASSHPSNLELIQNFPNPFNPWTTIRYNLPHNLHITLSLCNMFGQVVSILAEGHQEAGIHELRFDGSSLASGMYFCRLQAGKLVAVKKLVLVR